MAEALYDTLTTPPDAVAMAKCRTLGVMLLIEVRGDSRIVHTIPWENWGDDNPG